jgi:hypothetical protein
MGKKSKKGATRAGAKPRAAAGKGKRSGSVGDDGASVASRDDLPIGTKAGVPGAVAYSLPPQPTANGKDQNNKENGSASASIPKAKAPAAVVAAAVAAPAPEEVLAKVRAAVAAHENKNDVWSGNLRDAVKADAEGPAVLDVSMDADMGDSAPAEPKIAVVAEPKVAVAAVVAPKAEPVIQSRGFELTEPAPEEAKNKVDDCKCAIL